MKGYFYWLLKLFTLVLMFAFIVPLLISAVSYVINKGEMASLKDDRVAVVEIMGEIKDTKDIISELYKQGADKSIKGIVLRIDSPGGAVGPSQDVYAAVNAVKKMKPVIASMGQLAASGGLYSAVSATKIYAEPGTLTGSLGVIMQIPNFTKITEKVGFDMITLKSGALKDAGNPFRAMTDEDRAYLEGRIQEVREQFLTAVADGRGLSKEAVEKFADGRVLTGKQAKDLGLIDSFGDIYAAAREVFVQLNKPLPENTYPELYYPGEKFKQLRGLLKTFSGITETINSYINPKMQMKYL